MASEDGNVWCVFNGEIYNYRELKSELSSSYRFKTDCDTEVLIAAYLKWGEDCVTKFNGMFAFGIYDFRSDRLFLARDRFGVKPLYFWQSGKTFVFASELKPIMLHPQFDKKIDKSVLGDYLFHQYIASPRSIFTGVRKLEPGTSISLHDGSCKVRTYWSPRKVLSSIERHKGRASLSDNELVEELDVLLTDAVSLRMRSDVPVGAFLSGGVDSSLVVAKMAQAGNGRVKTFTIGFDEEEYNEAPTAKKIASELGTDHSEMYVSVEDLKKLIPKIPLHYDEPMADASLLPTMVVSELAKQHVSVVLGGDGGDELFCGYTKYFKDRIARKASVLRRALSPFAFLIDGDDLLFANPRFSRALRYRRPTDLINLPYKSFVETNMGCLAEGCTFNTRYYVDESLSDSFKMLFSIQDIETYLPDDIMAKVDRATMAKSLEARSPLLDYRIAEFALRLPERMKFDSNSGKTILKMLLKQHLPENIINLPKKGFGVPVGKWLKSDWDGFFSDRLSRDYILRQGVFDYGRLSHMVDTFKAGRGGVTLERLVWSVFVFQLWYEEYIR